ncbi:MAG: hypothetical protein KAH30_02150 [Caldisericia bacterium]|nr:hypothetical protein [Caldisericia bacterium]
MRQENEWSKLDLAELAGLHTIAERKRGYVAYGNKYGIRYTIEKAGKKTLFDDVEEAKKFMGKGAK